ncbi:hypothetical protein [Phenylobacterium sp.]|jgi:hypothetical protein|uniref:hypothetical protein n=1 Tax=Phenylobacterium sp. TaxID=1871053 RepID=UPI002F42ADF4
MGALINEDRFGVCQLAVDVASVAANTTAEQTFTLRGLRSGDFVSVVKPSLNAGLGVVNARVSATDTIAIKFVNATGGAIDPVSETYLIFWFRGEKTPTAVNP